jgi:hypothetical protein
MKFKIPILLASLLLRGSLAFAQSPDAPEFLQLRTLLIPRQEPRVVFVAGDGKWEALRISPLQPSPPQKVRNLNPLPVYNALPTDGAEAPVPSASVPLPGGTTDILLLCVPNGTADRYVAVADDIRNAKASDWRLINASSSPIALRIGDADEPFILPANSQRSYNIRDALGQGASVTAAARIEGETRTFYSTYWPLHEDKRALVLFVQDGERIQVRLITEAPVPESP